MDRTLRYAVAVLVGGVVTSGIALVTSNPVQEMILLLGIALVYVVGTAVVLRYPDVWNGSGNWVSGAFAGVLTFGTLSLLSGAAPDRNFAVAALGWGLAVFGFVAGVAFERERDAAAEAADNADGGPSPTASEADSSD